MSDLFPPLPPGLDSEPTITFDFVDVDLPSELDLSRISTWIERVIAQHEATLGTLGYIFCNDEYLHRLNVEYLDHDTLTDIITFPYGDPPQVSGELYISTERVADNAADRDLPIAQELLRVIIHGVLHLCGYGDKTPEEAQRMRKLEAEALNFFNLPIQ